jgi:anti-anti-sigma factor
MTPACPPKTTLEIPFQGRLDTARCAEMESDLRARIAEAGGAITFDLAGVDFVSSSFLRLCVFAYQKVRGDGFQIVNASPTIKKVFKIAGLDKMLKEE